MLDGYRRSYDYYLPKQPPAKPSVVFAIHGSGMDSRTMRAATYGEFDRLADEYGFIVVYPNGFGGGWNDLRSKSPHTAKRLNLDDIVYFKRILEGMGKRFNIDSDHAFYFGLCNGGQMVLRLMVQAPEIVSAAALVGANLPVEANAVSSYEGLRSAPTMFVHGTGDSIVPYAGGDVRLFYIMDFGAVHSTVETVKRWVAAAGHHQEPITSHIDAVDDDTSVDLLRWHGPGRAEVRLYRVNNGGHTIPMPRMAECSSPEETSHDLNTIREAWSFFEGSTS